MPSTSSPSPSLVYVLIGNDGNDDWAAAAAAAAGSSAVPPPPSDGHARGIAAAADNVCASASPPPSILIVGGGGLASPRPLLNVGRCIMLVGLSWLDSFLYGLMLRVGGGGACVSTAEVRRAPRPIGKKLTDFREDDGFVLDAGDWKRVEELDPGGGKICSCAPIASLPAATAIGDAYGGGGGGDAFEASSNPRDSRTCRGRCWLFLMLSPGGVLVAGWAIERGGTAAPPAPSPPSPDFGGVARIEDTPSTEM